MADDFPWRRISALQVQADFAKLRERVVRDAVCWPIRVCFAGYECSDWTFQKHRLAVSSNGRPSCVDLWRTERVRVETYFAEKGKTDLQASLKFLGKAPAHFPPYVAAMMYKHLGSKRVYDPYAGWGDRCVAAMAIGVDYLGVDSNLALQSPYQQLIETLPHTGNIRFVSGRSEEVTLGDYQPDLVFTSPPFWTKSRRLLESYPMCEPDMNNLRWAPARARIGGRRRCRGRAHRRRRSCRTGVRRPCRQPRGVRPDERARKHPAALWALAALRLLDQMGEAVPRAGPPEHMPNVSQGRQRPTGPPGRVPAAAPPRRDPAAWPDGRRDARRPCGRRVGVGQPPPVASGGPAAPAGGRAASAAPARRWLS